MSIMGPIYTATCELCDDSVSKRARTYHEARKMFVGEGWFIDYSNQWPKACCWRCAETARKAMMIRRGIE